MIIEAILLLIFTYHLFWGLLYLILGIFFFIDDLLAETKDISVMKKLPPKIQEENTLKLIGSIFFIIQLIWFLILMFLFKIPKF